MDRRSPIDGSRASVSVPLAIRVTDEDRAAHRQFIATLGEAAIWLDYVKLGLSGI